MLPVPQRHKLVLFLMSYAPDEKWSRLRVLPPVPRRYKGQRLAEAVGISWAQRPEMDPRAGHAPAYLVYETSASRPMLAGSGGRSGDFNPRSPDYESGALNTKLFVQNGPGCASSTRTLFRATGFEAVVSRSSTKPG